MVMRYLAFLLLIPFCNATCAENENVVNNTCTTCPYGSTRPAGDDASGEDTTCDCPAGLRSFISPVEAPGCGHQVCAGGIPCSEPLGNVTSGFAACDGNGDIAVHSDFPPGNGFFYDDTFELMNGRISAYESPSFHDDGITPETYLLHVRDCKRRCRSSAEAYPDTYDPHYAATNSPDGMWNGEFNNFRCVCQRKDFGCQIQNRTTDIWEIHFLATDCVECRHPTCNEAGSICAAGTILSNPDTACADAGCAECWSI